MEEKFATVDWEVPTIHLTVYIHHHLKLVILYTECTLDCQNFPLPPAGDCSSELELELDMNLDS